MVSSVNHFNRWNITIFKVPLDRTWMDINGKLSELPLYFCVLEWSFRGRMQSLAIIWKDYYEEQNPAKPNWDSVNISNGLTIPTGWLSFVDQHGRLLFTKQNSLSASRGVPHLCQMIDLSHFIRVSPELLFFLWWIFCTEWSPTFSLVLEHLSPQEIPAAMP